MSGRFRKRGHAPQTVLTDNDVAFLERNTRCVLIMIMMMITMMMCIMMRMMIMMMSGTMRRTSESGSGDNCQIVEGTLDDTIIVLDM